MRCKRIRRLNLFDKDLPNCTGAGVLREAMEKNELPERTRPDALASFILNSWEGALLRSQAEKSDGALKDFMSYVFGALLAK